MNLYCEYFVPRKDLFIENLILIIVVINIQNNYFIFGSLFIYYSIFTRLLFNYHIIRYQYANYLLFAVHIGK